MRIALVVPGRFHAFDLALALRERGHEVVVFTNYPKWAARRFGLPGKAVRSFWLHGLLFRLTWGAHQRWGWPYPEAWLNRLFGRWAVRALEREAWDVIHPWSALAEEILIAYQNQRARIFLMRGSTHIRTQARLLGEEEKRTGAVLDQPSGWVVEREVREYALAERIVVLSSFAENSFVAEGVPASKLLRFTPAVSVERFRATPEIVEARCRRIESGAPLRVLYVGTLSYQKGFFDLQRIIEQLPPESFKFCLVGPPLREVEAALRRLSTRAEIPGAHPERELPRWYAEGDVFIFPTVQDGFAMVLAQAAASRLPILATENCGAADLARTTPAVWTLPIRRPESFVERLRWCDQHRTELAKMIRSAAAGPAPRSWSEAATEFEALVKKD